MKWPCDVAAWSAVTVEEDVTLLKRCVAFLAVAGHSRFKIWCFFFVEKELRFNSNLNAVWFLLEKFFH